MKSFEKNELTQDQLIKFRGGQDDNLVCVVVNGTVICTDVIDVDG